MDFVERLLHVSPDHGNGALEFALFFAIGVVVCAGVLRTLVRKRVRHASNRLSVKGES